MRTLICLSLLWFVAAGAPAPAAENPYVPPELEPWREWVLEGQEHRRCALRYDAAGVQRDDWFCRWPGVLAVTATAGQAEFRQDWELATAGWVPVPGSAEYWPENVRDGGTRLQPIERDGTPHVWLEAGQHTLGGRLTWTSRPAALPIPASTGLVSLQLDGRVVGNPQRSAAALWFGRRPSAAAAPERIDVNVYRVLADGAPITLTTRVELAVSGAAREAVLGRILPAGFAPVALASPLPARIEADGRLRLQVRPGNWQIEFVARATDWPEAVGFVAGDGAWAGAEIWSYRADPALRVTLAEGAEPVDPTQAGVPRQWLDLPAFRLAPGASLRIVERSRGRADDMSNRLQLNRQMWLDFSGEAFTIADQIYGEMQTGWRLEMMPPYRLASARSADAYRLVTRLDSAAPDVLGVEVREPQAQLQALSRLPGRGAVPATGWDQRFDNVQATVHLPFGYELLAVAGADYSPGTWLSRWRLIDYFVVLLIAVAFWRLFGVLTGAVALATLALIYHEAHAPVWSWLVVLVGVALARHAPEGGMRSVSTLLRNVALVALALIAVWFAALQLRAAMFPQLEPAVRFGHLDAAQTSTVDYVRVKRAAPVAASKMTNMVAEELSSEAYDEVTVTGSVLSPGRRLEPYEPGALLQTGPGMPNWAQKSYQIGWNGPVGTSQQLRLVILDAHWYRILRVIGVALVAWLIWRLLRDGAPPLRLPGRAALLPALALIAGGLSLPAPPAHADIPGNQILEELRTRLTRPPDCAPRCAEIAEARIDVDADRLMMALVVQAQQEVVIPLPGGEAQWTPATVSLDGVPVAYLQRNDQRELLVRIPAGTHLLGMDGPLAATDSVRIGFPLAPRRVQLAATGWEQAGVVDGRLPGGVLELIRIRSAEPTQSALEAERFPPFVRVIRQIAFDIDWRITTRVERIAPQRGAFTVSVPLLEDERIVTESVSVRDNAALISFATAAQAVSYESTLPRAAQLTLSAPAADQHIEVWQLLASPTWRVDYSGTPVIAIADSGGNYWMPQFHPRPGETLQVDVTRPAAVDGATLAFDAVNVSTMVGERSRETNLALDYRSSRGGQHSLLLPADAEVVEVTVGGAPLAVRPSDGALQVPIVPGSHSLAIRFTQERDVRVTTSTPLVHIGAPGSNVSLRLQVPENRWVLWTRGPRTGPAVLYWPELALFVLIALALGRLRLVPLKTWEWVVLGVGFSTHSWPVLVLIAAWLFAFAWRHRGSMPAGASGFNLVQVALAVLTLVAVAALIVVIPMALLGSPDMQIAGHFSSAHNLMWFADRTEGAVPAAGVVSAPLWIYKTALLLWALWLSFALIGWLRWAWRGWTQGGVWRKRVKKRPGPTAPAQPVE